MILVTCSEMEEFEPARNRDPLALVFRGIELVLLLSRQIQGDDGLQGNRIGGAAVEFITLQGEPIRIVAGVNARDLDGLAGHLVAHVLVHGRPFQLQKGHGDNVVAAVALASIEFRQGCLSIGVENVIGHGIAKPDAGIGNAKEEQDHRQQQQYVAPGRSRGRGHHVHDHGRDRVRAHDRGYVRDLVHGHDRAN